MLPASNGGVGVTDYIIQRSPNGTSGWVTINDGVRTTTSYTVTGLVNGTRYYFRVLAKNATGNSSASNVVNAVPRTVPAAPSGLRATARVRSVTLTWNAPATGGSPITDYVIQRSTNGTTWTTVADGVSTPATYTVTGLTTRRRLSLPGGGTQRRRHRSVQHSSDRPRNVIDLDLVTSFPETRERRTTRSRAGIAW